MKFNKTWRRKIRHSQGGVNVVGDVNAAVSATVNEPGPSHTSVSSKQRVVQRGGRTEVSEESHDHGRRGS